MIEIETPELNVKFKWPAVVVVVVAGAAPAVDNSHKYNFIVFIWNVGFSHDSALKIADKYKHKKTHRTKCVYNGYLKKKNNK